MNRVTDPPVTANVRVELEDVLVIVTKGVDNHAGLLVVGVVVESTRVVTIVVATSSAPRRIHNKKIQ